MSGAEHYLRLPMPGLPTQLNSAPSPPPALCVFTACLRPPLASASSFGSHAGALTRYTLPPHLPVVSSVRLHAGDKTYKTGVYANLRCCAASSYGGCGAKLVGPIRKSSERPTNVDCFRELGRVIQRDHGPTCIAAEQELKAAEKAAADAST
jgi:hypothetical protein